MICLYPRPENRNVPIAVVGQAGMSARAERLRALARRRASGKISSLEYLEAKEGLSRATPKKRARGATNNLAGRRDRELRELRERRDRGETSPLPPEPVQPNPVPPISRRDVVEPRSGFLLTKQSVANGRHFARNILRFGIVIGVSLLILALIAR